MFFLHLQLQLNFYLQVISHSLACFLFLPHHFPQNHYSHQNFDCIFSFFLCFTLLFIQFDFLPLIIMQNYFKEFNSMQKEVIKQFGFFRMQLIFAILLFFRQLNTFLNRLRMDYGHLKQALHCITMNYRVNYYSHNHYFVNNFNYYIDCHYNNCYYLQKELSSLEINLSKNQEQ